LLFLPLYPNFISIGRIDKMRECPRCKSKKIVSDYVHGETYCGKCGFVIEENLFDFGPEWRAFDREDLDKRARTGGLLRYAKLTKGLTTEIDKYDRDIKGKAVPVESKAKLYRLRKWQKRSRMATSLQRNLSIALPELDRMCSYLKIPNDMKEECARLYRKAASDGLVKGRSIESMVAGVIYIVTRQNKSPVTLEELEEVSGKTKKDIGKSYKKIAHAYDIKIPTATPMDFVPRIANRLGASGSTIAKANEILKKAIEVGIMAGKVPLSVAAAAVYLAAELTGDKNVPRKIDDIPGASKNIIQDRYNDLKKRVLGKLK